MKNFSWKKTWIFFGKNVKFFSWKKTVWVKAFGFTKSCRHNPYGLARRRRENFPDPTLQNAVRNGVLEALECFFRPFLKGFRSLWGLKIPQIFRLRFTDKKPPLNSFLWTIRGGFLIWGVFLSGIPLMWIPPRAGADESSEKQLFWKNPVIFARQK